MITGALTERAKELTEQGSAFVIATVVRVQRPTSVEPGSVAIVRGDGTIEGFVGGVCAEHSVRLYSLRALETGQPLLLRILPDADAAADGEEDPSLTEEIEHGEGTVTVQNPCLSGGAIEAFLEPVLPAPRMLLSGDSPIVAALRRIAPEVGLEVLSASDRGAAGIVPAPGDLALVVAAHGRDELGILRAALEVGLPYVGLVASHKRGAAVREQLLEAGTAEELVSKLETPAGLDIGARTAGEIAVSILARIIDVRRHATVKQTLPQGLRPLTAVDPICGMTVVVDDDTPSLTYAGETSYFCCLGCMLKFEERLADAAAG
jgi:xanthine dehydrogenase accessory factor